MRRSTVGAVALVAAAVVLAGCGSRSAGGAARNDDSSGPYLCSAVVVNNSPYRLTYAGTGPDMDPKNPVWGNAPRDVAPLSTLGFTNAEPGPSRCTLDLKYRIMGYMTHAGFQSPTVRFVVENTWAYNDTKCPSGDIFCRIQDKEGPVASGTFTVPANPNI